MGKKREIAVLTLFWLACLPLWGGTGRPSDGFLSFILVLGFLMFLLGILQLGAYVKRKIHEFMGDIF